jgi:hypothetical protein
MTEDAPTRPASTRAENRGRPVCSSGQGKRRECGTEGQRSEGETNSSCFKKSVVKSM